MCNSGVVYGLEGFPLLFDQTQSPIDMPEMGVG